jgi:hypothetical protein
MSPARCSEAATTPGWTLHAEHDRQELMAQVEVLFVHPIVRHQEPASRALRHLMQRCMPLTASSAR